jgi:hypothetical protein
LKNKRLEMEVAILKKASVYFAKQMPWNSNSSATIKKNSQ